MKNMEEMIRWKNISTIIIGILFFWFTLDITGFSIGNFTLVVSCFVDNNFMDFIWWCVFIVGISLYIFKDKIGRYFMLVFLVIWAFIQGSIYFRTIERIESYNNYFDSWGTHRLFPTSDTFIIKDTYHIFIDVLILASLVSLIVFIIKGVRISKRKLCLALFAPVLMFLHVACGQNNSIIQKGNISYDFTFAELAVKYLETSDSAYLHRITELNATEHMYNHSKRFNYDVPNDTKLELVTYLLSSVNKDENLLANFKRNLDFAKRNIAKADFPQMIALQYLPENFNFSGSLFFTFGYDLGVAYANNASLNLAHSYFQKNMEELKYYAIHELHHAGFVALKNNVMPSLDITTYGEMAQIIEYLTHLEGMATYAPLEIRIKENAIDVDSDYVTLRDSAQMREYEKEYFDIYFHFKNNPDSIITDDDWYKIYVLSDEKRLLYIIGAFMAQAIDQQFGREKLVNLISESSENFIITYLKTR